MGVHWKILFFKGGFMKNQYGHSSNSTQNADIYRYSQSK